MEGEKEVKRVRLRERKEAFSSRRRGKKKENFINFFFLSHQVATVRQRRDARRRRVEHAGARKAGLELDDGEGDLGGSPRPCSSAPAAAAASATAVVGKQAASSSATTSTSAVTRVPGLQALGLVALVEHDHSVPGRRILRAAGRPADHLVEPGGLPPSAGAAARWERERGVGEEEHGPVLRSLGGGGAGGAAVAIELLRALDYLFVKW